MNRHVVRLVKLLPFGIVAVAVVGFVVMSLWNWLMPALFGLKQIGFWQALGVFILSKLLLGGFHGGRRGMHSRRRIIERWERMTPEEREKFREGLRARCGHFEQRQAKPTAEGPGQ